jgi:hypothetical protein
MNLKTYGVTEVSQCCIVSHLLCFIIGIFSRFVKKWFYYYLFKIYHGIIINNVQFVIKSCQKIVKIVVKIVVKKLQQVVSAVILMLSKNCQ